MHCMNVNIVLQIKNDNKCECSTVVEKYSWLTPALYNVLIYIWYIDMVISYYFLF